MRRTLRPFRQVEIRWMRHIARSPSSGPIDGSTQLRAAVMASACRRSALEIARGVSQMRSARRLGIKPRLCAPRINDGEAYLDSGLLFCELMEEIYAAAADR